MVTLLQVAYVGSLAGIGAGLLIGARTGNGPAVVNGAGAIVVALLPAIVEVGFRTVGLDVAFATGLSLALAVAGFLHVIGMLGWYDTIPW